MHFLTEYPQMKSLDFELSSLVKTHILFQFEFHYCLDITAVLYHTFTENKPVQTHQRSESHITWWHTSFAEPRTELAPPRTGPVLGDTKSAAIDAFPQMPGHFRSTLKILDAIGRLRSSWQWNVSTKPAVVWRCDPGKYFYVCIDL